MRRGPARPGLAMATGVIVGSAVAGRRAEARQEQAQYQQMQSAQLAQANADAAAAQQRAAQQQYQAPPPQQQQYQPPTQAYAVAEPSHSSSSSSVGKQMLSEALDSQPSVDDLVALKKQLNVVQVMCEQAMGMYRQSMELMKRAQRSNTAGAVIGLARPGVRPLDVAMDAKREGEMKAATQPAEKASAMLIEGFKKVPNALRIRYPTEMSRVGDVPIAKLQIGGFGRAMVATAMFGQTGNTMNDLTSARRIRENEEALATCMRTVSEQQQLMAIVQARLDQDIANTSRAAPAAAPAIAYSASAPAAPAAVAPPPPAISSIPPPIAPQNYVEVTAPHIVDEYNPAMQQHQIISVPLGAVVRLVRGDLQNGLGAPYNDYIEVDYNGRVGKISRLVARSKQF